MRQFVIQRDRGICQICHKLIAGRADVHHIEELTAQNYQNPRVAFDPDNLITAHKECHDREHERFSKKSIVDDDLNVDYSKR